jgi:hypothetical protein
MAKNENFLNLFFQYQSRLSIYALQYCIKMARIEEIKNSHLGTFNVLVRSPSQVGRSELRYTYLWLKAFSFSL